MSNYRIWSKKIKDTFDPENLSESVAFLEVIDLPEGQSCYGSLI